MSLLCFGEVFTNLSATQNNSTLKPLLGGSAADVAINFAKLNPKSSFTGIVSHDHFGEQIYQQLRELGVKTGYCKRTDKFKTSLALHFNPASEEPIVEFYRSEFTERCFQNFDFCLKAFEDHHMLHVCATGLDNKHIYRTTLKALEQANNSNQWISFDINLYLRTLSSPQHTLSRIIRCAAMTHLIYLNTHVLNYLCQLSNKPITADAMLEKIRQNHQIILMFEPSQTLKCFTPSELITFKLSDTDTLHNFNSAALLGRFLHGIWMQTQDNQKICRSKLIEALAFSLPNSACSLSQP
jgi:sugar/nucleoside kinase (ribokinase family)